MPRNTAASTRRKSAKVRPAQVLWGRYTVHVEDPELLNALWQEIEDARRAKKHRPGNDLAVRWVEPGSSFPDTELSYGFPQLPRYPAAEQLFATCFGLQLPCVLRVRTSFRDELTLVVVRVRLIERYEGLLRWGFEGYQLYADGRIGGAVNYGLELDPYGHYGQCWHRDLFGTWHPTTPDGAEWPDDSSGEAQGHQSVYVAGGKRFSDFIAYMRYVHDPAARP